MLSVCSVQHPLRFWIINDQHPINEFILHLPLPARMNNEKDEINRSMLPVPIRVLIINGQDEIKVCYVQVPLPVLSRSSTSKTWWINYRASRSSCPDEQRTRRDKSMLRVGPSPGVDQQHTSYDECMYRPGPSPCYDDNEQSVINRHIGDGVFSIFIHKEEHYINQYGCLWAGVIRDLPWKCGISYGICVWTKGHCLENANNTGSVSVEYAA